MWAAGRNRRRGGGPALRFLGAGRRQLPPGPGQLPAGPAALAGVRGALQPGRGAGRWVGGPALRSAVLRCLTRGRPAGVCAVGCIALSLRSLVWCCTGAHCAVRAHSRHGRSRPCAQGAAQRRCAGGDAAVKAKALFRRGQALAGLGKKTEAAQDIQVGPWLLFCFPSPFPFPLPSFSFHIGRGLYS